MEPMIHVGNLTKRYKKATIPAVDDISFDVHARRAVRLPRAERRRQDHHDLDPDDDPGQDEPARSPSPATTSIARRPRSGATSGSSSRTRASTRTCRARRTSGSTSRSTGSTRYRPFYRLMPADYRERVERLAGVVGLGDDLFKPLKTFSGGMKRKLEIIRSLMHRPGVLFLDEPTIGSRPGQPARPVGLPARGPQRGRHDHLPDDALPRGGRGGRSGLRHRPRPDRGDRHAGRAQAPAPRSVDPARRRRPARRSLPSCSGLGLDRGRRPDRAAPRALTRPRPRRT